MNGIRYNSMINGVVHSWSSVQVIMGCVPVTGINKIDYDSKQTKEAIYGAGQNPVGKGYGKIENSCTIGLLRDEVEAMRAASPTGRLADLAPFNIIVQYLPVSGQKKVTHRILGAEFTNDGGELNEGDTSDYNEYELLVSDIRYN
mgnify:CR=1 FL=1